MRAGKGLVALLVPLSLAACTSLPGGAAGSTALLATARARAGVTCALGPASPIVAAAVPDANVAVGRHRIGFTRGRSLHLPAEADSFMPLDSTTIAYAVPAGEPLAIGAWRLRGGSTFLTDASHASARRLCLNGAVTDASADGRRLLLMSIEDGRVVLTVVDRAGRVLDSLPAEGAAHGVFLADGAVAVADGGRLGVWKPAASPRWVSLPSELGEVMLVAVGSNVVAYGDRGLAALVDPRTGTVLGRPWAPGLFTGIAASPDGFRFASAVQTGDGPRGTVEIRDATTGAVALTAPGRELSVIDSLAWLSDDTLLVLRADTGTNVTPVPELYAVDRTAIQGPVVGMPLLGQMFGVIARGGNVLSYGPEGSLALQAVEEAGQ